MENKKNINEKIVIGLGTGRSGTQSLAKFLDTPHQGRVYKWNGVDDIDFEFLSEKGGDVGNYYLNYVYKITEHFGSDQVLFVCVIRDKQETIDSFLKKFEEDKIDPFNKNLLPDISADNLAEKVSKYYDIYLERARDLEHSLPNFKIFSLQELNSPIRINRFLGQVGKDGTEKSVEKIRSYCKIFA